MRIYQSINKIYLENAEGNNIAALEIEYRGNANLTSTFPNSCLARHNDNKIVVINMSNTPIIDLFEYSGDIMLLSCRATDRELNQFNLSVKTDETDEWQTKNGVWEDLVGSSSFPEKLNKSSKMHKSQPDRIAKIVKEKLRTGVEEKKLTAAEKRKKEDIIMALKKQKGGKKKLEPVDYAVATDRAKKLAEKNEK